jgi:uncharacterized protein (DUF736 family)
MEIKFFNLQKNNKKSEGQPDYRISMRNEDTFFEGGACWIKKDKNGNTFLSCKLGDAWKDHTDESKSRKGFHIEEDKPVKMAKTEDEQAREVLSANDPF